MILWIGLVAYVLLGIGTARHTVAGEYVEFMSYYTTHGRSKREARAEIRRDDMPFLWFVGIATAILWPLVWVFLLIIRPVGTVVGPAFAKWWRGPMDKKLQKAGLS